MMRVGRKRERIGRKEGERKGERVGRKKRERVWMEWEGWEKGQNYRRRAKVGRNREE